MFRAIQRAIRSISVTDHSIRKTEYSSATSLFEERLAAKIPSLGMEEVREVVQAATQHRPFMHVRFGSEAAGQYKRGDICAP